jgi:hypothetical protein
MKWKPPATGRNAEPLFRFEHLSILIWNLFRISNFDIRIC